MTHISNNNHAIIDTDIDTNINSLKKTNRRPTLRNKIIGAVCGATLMMGAFSFLPNMEASTDHQNMNTHHTITASNVGTHKVESGISAVNSKGTVVSAAPVSSSYQSIARQAAMNNGINPDLFVRQIQQESGFNPNATSYVGAQGIAQFMPGTAAAMGVNPHDPVSALNGAARLMADLNRQFGGDYAKALAAYNAGPGNVQNAVASGGGNWLAHTPAETQHYVHTILG